MSLFVHLFVPPSVAEVVPQLVEGLGILAKQSSVRPVSAHLTSMTFTSELPSSELPPSTSLVAYELVDGPGFNLEAALLDPAGGSNARLEAYRALGVKLGRAVTWFHDDAVVDEAYLACPMNLPAETLVSQLLQRCHPDPIFLEFDVEGSLSPQCGRHLIGLPSIRHGLWKAVAFGDLEESLVLCAP